MQASSAVLALTAFLPLATSANAHEKSIPIPSPQATVQTQQDSGLYFTKTDKSEHAAFGALLGFAGRLQFPANRWHALAVPTAVSALKELVDATQRGNYFSGKDLAAGIAGGILGMVLADGVVYLTRSNGTTTLAFVKAFR